MTSFRLTVPFGPHESLASFASRTAAACGLANAQRLGGDLGFRFVGLATGNLADIEKFAAIVGVQVGDISGGIVRKTDTFHEIGGELVKLAPRSRLRICPHCILEDGENMSGRRAHRAYGRVNWLVAAVRTCPVHSTNLVTSDMAMSPELTHDFAVNLALERDRMQLFLAQSTATCRDDLDSYVVSRMTKTHQPKGWLEALPLYAVARLAETVGATERRGKRFDFAEMDESEWSKCAHTGFQIIAEGEQGFTDFLLRLHAPFFEGKGDFGGRSIYGRLYEMLAYSHTDPAYDAVRKVMREVAIDCLPLGPGEVFFTPVETRRWHSIESASIEFDIHPKRLRKLLESEGFIDADVLSRSNERILLDAPKVSTFLVANQSGLTATLARRYINAPRVPFESLVRHGLLKADVEPGNEGGIQPRFMTAELDRFLVSIRSKVTVAVPTDNLVTIQEANKIARSRITKVHELLLLGGLRTVAMVPDDFGYMAIRIDPSEIVKKTKLPDHEILTLRQLEKMLPAKSSVVAALVKAGHLKTVQVRNPINRNFQTTVMPMEVERFKNEFISLGELARWKGTAAWALLVKIKDGVVKTAFDCEPIGVQYFRRSELTAN